MAESPSDAGGAVLVGRVSIVLEKGKARGSYVVPPPDGQHGDWEYVAVAHAQEVGLSRTAAAPLIVLDPVPRARFDRPKARVGDQVTLTADLQTEPPAGLQFLLYKSDELSEKDDLAATLTPKCGDGKAVATWKVEYKDQTLKSETHEEFASINPPRFRMPGFYFVVQGADKKVLCDSGRDPAEMLLVRDVIDRPFQDEHTNQPMPGMPYEITFADGEKRRGHLTEESRVHEDDVPPCAYWIRIVTGEVKTFDPGEIKDGVAPPAGPPRLGTKAPPAVKEPVPPVRIINVDASPTRVESGKPVDLIAHLVNAKDGEAVTFIVHRAGANDAVATLAGTVSGGQAKATWTVAGATGHRLGAWEYADFDVEVRAGRSLFRTPDRPEFRGFTRRK